MPTQSHKQNLIAHRLLVIWRQQMLVIQLPLLISMITYQSNKMLLIWPDGLASLQIQTAEIVKFKAAKF